MTSHFLQYIPYTFNITKYRYYTTDSRFFLNRFTFFSIRPLIFHKKTTGQFLQGKQACRNRVDP